MRHLRQRPRQWASSLALAQIRSGQGGGGAIDGAPPDPREPQRAEQPGRRRSSCAARRSVRRPAPEVRPAQRNCRSPQGRRLWLIDPVNQEVTGCAVFNTPDVGVQENPVRVPVHERLRADVRASFQPVSRHGAYQGTHAARQPAGCAQARL